MQTIERSIGQDRGTIERNIGQNRGKPRLWIEGPALRWAGLLHGMRWDLVPCGEGFDICANTEGRRKIAGTPKRPFIDISGDSLGAVGAMRRVRIFYEINSGRMAVRNAEGAN